MNNKERNWLIFKTVFFTSWVFASISAAHFFFVTHPKEVEVWEDKYQVEKQRGDTCLHNFEVIEPQLQQGEVYIRLDTKEAGQSGVVK